MKGKQKKGLSFVNAVIATEDIQNCFQTGLKALGKYSTKIKVKEPKKICGSLDIDNCVKKKYPQDNRWDYAVCYDNEVYFVEVHTANTSEVNVVLRKLQWLKNWLNESAPEINRLKAKSKTPFYWIQSNGNHILPNSPQAKAIALKGLRPVAFLNLP